MTETGPGKWRYDDILEVDIWDADFKSTRGNLVPSPCVPFTSKCVEPYSLRQWLEIYSAGPTNDFEEKDAFYDSLGDDEQAEGEE